jgi:hypothetical protein
MAVESRYVENYLGRGQGVSKFGEGLTSWSLGMFGGRSGKSEASAHPLLGSSPIMPALLFLVALVLLISFVESRDWFGLAGNISGSSGMLALVRKHRSHLPQDSVKVWTKKQFGFYYCQGDVLFGRKPGELTTQAEALLAGYRPLHSQYCASNKPKEESRRGGSAHPPEGAK